MPAIVAAALISGLVAGGVAVAVGTIAFTTAFVTAFATSLVMGAITKATAKKPQQPQISAEGRTVSIKQAIPARQVIMGRCRVGGAVSFMHQKIRPTDISSLPGLVRFVAAVLKFDDLHIVITLSGHPVQAIDEVWFGNEILSLDGSGNAGGRYSGLVRVQTSLGTEAGQPFPDLVSESDGLWSQNHLQRGCAKIYVRLTFNPDVFPQGVPNISCVVRGLQAYDPRSMSTIYTSNPAILLAHYFTNTDFGLGADYAEEINEDQLISAANSCDETVGSEARFSANGAFLVDDTPRNIIGRLLASMAGKAVQLGDTWRIHAGVYESPNVSLDESDVAGPIDIQSMVDGRDNANAVGGQCVFPNRYWQPDDFPAIVSDTYRDEDGGELIPKNLDLTAFVTSSAQAQRLAKIELLSLRQGLTVGVPFKLTAYGLAPGGTMTFSLAKYGWVDKVFAVQGVRFTVAGDGTLGIYATLRETAAAIFDWNTSEEQTVDIAPNTTLPDPRDLPAPGAPQITEENYETRDGMAVATKAIVEWVPSDYQYAVTYQFEYKPHDQDEWIVLPIVRPPSGTIPSIEVLDLAAGRYDFRVKAVNLVGVSSSYAEQLNWEIIGLGDTPNDLTGISIQAAGGVAILTWDLSPDPDVRKGGRILIRHSGALTGAVWNESTSIGEVDSWPGNSVMAIVPLKEGTYMIMAEDSTGLRATNPAMISTKQAHVLTFSPLSNITEDPTFPGTNSNTVVDSGNLKLGAAGLFDDIPDLDAAASIDDFGGLVPAGTYTFSVGADLGSVKHARVTSDVAVQVVNVLDFIDSRTADIDDWADFDGAVGNVVGMDCWVELRETDDNPAGSPTWSDWKRVDASEHIARAFQFRAQLTSADPAYNILVSRLRIDIDQV